MRSCSFHSAGATHYRITSNRIGFLLSLMAVLLLLPLLSCSGEEAKIAAVDATNWIIGKDPSAYIPEKMIDGDETTAFQFSTAAVPLGQEYLFFTLDAPSDIDTLWIKNGFWKKTNGNDQYVRNSRVKRMTVDFLYSGAADYADGITVTVPDDRSRKDWTTIDLQPHSDVIVVRFLIEEIYKGSKYKTDVCISEVRFTSGDSARPEELYGLATDKLATRSGPGTQYAGKGTYSVAGQYIRVLSRAWDSRNGIWWVKCAIPYKKETRILWTGYKRFDSETLPLESIPIETVTYTADVPAASDSQDPHP